MALIFVYNGSCPRSMTLLRTLEQAIILLHLDADLLQVYDPHWTAPVVGKIHVDEFYQTAEFMGIPKTSVDQALAMFQVTSVPTLLFLQDIGGRGAAAAGKTAPMQHHGDDGNEEETNILPPQFLMLEYTGLQSSPSELTDGLWHYIYRLQFGHSESIRAVRRISKRESTNVLTAADGKMEPS